MRLPAIVGVAGGLVLALCAPARAQLAGSHTLGDYGVQAGSQPRPGFYDVVFYYRYSTDTIKDVDGNVVRSLGSPPSTVATAIADYLYFVSTSTIAGAHYGHWSTRRRSSTKRRWPKRSTRPTWRAASTAPSPRPDRPRRASSPSAREAPSPGTEESWTGRKTAVRRASEGLFVPLAEHHRTPLRQRWRPPSGAHGLVRAYASRVVGSPVDNARLPVGTEPEHEAARGTRVPVGEFARPCAVWMADPHEQRGQDVIGEECRAVHFEGERDAPEVAVTRINRPAVPQAIRLLTEPDLERLRVESVLENSGSREITPPGIECGVTAAGPPPIYMGFPIKRMHLAEISVDF